ncbi:Metallo-hydrolase/oxidoreductase [Colletotrichum zoysiae]|uniref:Metallo-hydrolase/oxidoreductase n=1 Tax=Colletotrichum zoysiae TaxID=1216348 RepID=A0AAD9HA35_9PEZI|nr:Metallo-hydrolase/oxidoreductase [Colletotrichum zoysiae]
MASIIMPQAFYSSSFWTDYYAAQRSKLPLLRAIEDRISPRVVRFLGGNPGDMTLQGTNTYLVGTGKSRILIDTGAGHPSWIVNIAGYLDDHDISISQVLLTHWHGDHTGGVDDLLLFDSRVSIHKSFPNPKQHPISDGQTFSTEGASLKAVLSPGHTDDHTCFILEEEHALFTGDNVLGHGYSVADKLGTYTKSLRLMQGLGCTLGYPGHGDVVQNLQLVITRYIAQRESRELQVLGVLARSGRRTNLKGDHVDGTFQAEDGSKTGINQGLSVNDICTLLYGELVNDSAAFESALKPLINQVLLMFEEHSKVGSRQLEFGQTRYYWLAK